MTACERQQHNGRTVGRGGRGATGGADKEEGNERGRDARQKPGRGWVRMARTGWLGCGWRCAVDSRPPNSTSRMVRTVEMEMTRRGGDEWGAALFLRRQKSHGKRASGRRSSGHLSGMSMALGSSEKSLCTGVKRSRGSSGGDWYLLSPLFGSPTGWGDWAWSSALLGWEGFSRDAGRSPGPGKPRGGP